MDRLDEMFNEQLLLNSDRLGNDLKEKQTLTKETLLAIFSEVAEIQSQINWAYWKNERKVIDSNIHEEIIDLFKFSLNLCLVWGLNPDSFMEEFRRKSEIVRFRFQQSDTLKRVKDEGSKICAIDLDGVLVDYPRCWIDFINLQLSTSFKNLSEVKNKLESSVYFKLKDEYRKSGYKRDIPFKDGSKEFVDELKSMGYNIIILTSRPYSKYFRIFHDTKYSLDKNDIHYDAIFFDEKKHLKILDEVETLSFLVDDDENIVKKVSECGYKVYYVTTKPIMGDNIVNANCFQAILEDVKNGCE